MKKFFIAVICLVFLITPVFAIDEKNTDIKILSIDDCVKIALENNPNIDTSFLPYSGISFKVSVFGITVLDTKENDKSTLEIQTKHLNKTIFGNVFGKATIKIDAVIKYDNINPAIIAIVNTPRPPEILLAVSLTLPVKAAV